MNAGTISFAVGYIIIINLIPMVLMWFSVKTDIIKVPDKAMSALYILISLAGGFIGVLRGAEMFAYKQDSKLFKRTIPILIFLEVFVVLFIISQNVH